MEHDNSGTGERWYYPENPIFPGERYKTYEDMKIARPDEFIDKDGEWRFPVYKCHTGPQMNIEVM